MGPYCPPGGVEYVEMCNWYGPLCGGRGVGGCSNMVGGQVGLCPNLLFCSVSQNSMTERILLLHSPPPPPASLNLDIFHIQFSSVSKKS